MMDFTNYLQIYIVTESSDKLEVEHAQWIQNLETNVAYVKFSKCKILLLEVLNFIHENKWKSVHVLF